MTSEKTGETYYPKYHEDLVFSDIFLPENAPAEYKDRSTLWNSVEQAEKSKKAQLARTIKADLPNDWSYELASEIVAEFVKKTFVSKGMCADVAIHDSVNPDGQRNLHCHIMLTLRPILENGEWGAKSKKEYILDKDGNRIKMKSGNYKSRKVDLVDWNYAVNFADKNGLTDFAGVQAYMDSQAPVFDEKKDMLDRVENRLFWLNDWLKQYADYKPTKEVHDQSVALSGFKKKKFDKEHEHDLTMYGILRERLLSDLPEGEKTIAPKSWREEKKRLEKWIAENGDKISSKCYDLAMCEVIQYAQKDLQRIVGNEERANSRQKQQSQEQSKKKNREESL